jgi:uncharacterized membrane protein
MGHKKKSRRFRNFPSPQATKNPATSVQAVQSFQIEQYQGFLPHPRILVEFDNIVPGSAERIIKMVEDQAKHRQGLEQSVINSDIRDGRTGLIFGFIVSLVAILAGAYCISQGHAVAGTIIGGGAVPSLTGVFVYGSKQRRKEREAKQQIATQNK